MREATLYRHLEKTGGDKEAALTSLIGHLDWRRDNDVGASVSAWASTPGATEGERLCVLLGRMDVHGRPLLFIKPRVLGNIAVARAANDLCVASELGRRRIASLRNPLIHQLSVIIDLNGFGLSHFVRLFIIVYVAHACM